MNKIDLEEPRITRLLQQMNYNYNPSSTEKLKSEINNKKMNNVPFDLTDILKIFLWKLDRIIDQDTDSNFFEELNAFVNKEIIDINAPDTKDFLVYFNTLKGFHLPSISAVLKFLRPNIFAILDKRCYRIWKGTKPPSRYTVDIYIDYLNYLHDTARKIGFTIGELEEKMYELDKLINGTLNGHPSSIKTRCPGIEKILYVSHELRAGDVCLLCKDTELVEVDIYTFHEMLHRTSQSQTQSQSQIRTVSKTIINLPHVDWISICPNCDQYALGTDDNYDILLRDKMGRKFSTLKDYQDKIFY